MICYYGTWAAYRSGLGKFAVDDINSNLCTHLKYAFAGIDETGTLISLDPALDLDSGNGNYRKFTNLKQNNPDLKTILAVGGWNEGSAKYSVMAASAESRQNFIQSTLALISEYNFDGLDLDWLYPNQRDTVLGDEDIDNFSQLIKEMREEFDELGLLLTTAVAAVEQSASQSYDIPTFSTYLDFIHVMTYDMHGSWDDVTGHNAPLHRGEGDTEPREDLFTVDVAIEYWLNEGCPPEKLVLGMPLYGRTWTLINPIDSDVGAPAIGAGLPGPITATPGVLGFNEICVKLQTETWDVRYDSLAEVPYAVQDVQWVSYDDADSLTKKVEFANSLDLAGVMVWSIENDDFHGTCGSGNFPLLTAINNALGRNTDDPGTTENPVISEETDSTTENPVTESTDATQDSEGTDATTDNPVTDDTTEDTGTTEDPESSGATDATTETPVTTDGTTEDTGATEDPETSGATDTTTENPVTTDGITEDMFIGFACSEEGFTANPESFGSFYVCMKNAYGGLEPRKFLCPSGTYWSQSRLSCTTIL